MSNPPQTIIEIIRRETMIQVVTKQPTALVTVNRPNGMPGPVGPPGPSNIGPVKFVTTTPYQILQTVDYDLEVKVNTILAPATLLLPIGTPIGDEYVVSDSDLNSSTYHITIDAGVGNTIIGYNRAETFVLSIDGQVNTFKRISTTEWRVR